MKEEKERGERNRDYREDNLKSGRAQFTHKQQAHPVLRLEHSLYAYMYMYAHYMFDISSSYQATTRRFAPAR